MAKENKKDFNAMLYEREENTMKEKEFNGAIYMRVGTKEQIDDNDVKIQEEYYEFLTANKIVKDFKSETSVQYVGKNNLRIYKEMYLR